jgi:SAM-dependent methyltransferase
LAEDLRAAHTPAHLVLHREPVTVFACDSCGSVFRDPAAVGDVVDRYQQDHYPAGVLREIHDGARRELARDAAWLAAHGVVSGASLLEIGSYTGAFLEFARDAGCDARGVDVGRETAGFARDRGLDVSTEPFTADRYDGWSVDGIWVLNCFEQLPDPPQLVRDAARLLPPGGRLALRTPTAEFVRLAHHHATADALRASAANHAVLGVPFARCLSRRALLGLLIEHGFGVETVRGRRRGWAPSRFPAPWVDVVARRLEAGTGHKEIRYDWGILG